MVKRRTVWVALAGVLLTCSTAAAKYLPTPLEDLLGGSDLVVTGTIAAVRSETFVLRVDKLVAGAHEHALNLTVGAYDLPTLEVRRFRDWACASRWAPYAEGQRVLLCLFRVTPPGAAPEWQIRSGGGEGEMPITTDADGLEFVHCQRGGLPFGRTGRYPIHGGDLYATQVPLGRMLRAIRAYRRVFAWELDRSTPSPRVVAVRSVDAEAVTAFAGQGDIEAWLVEATRGSRYFRD